MSDKKRKQKESIAMARRQRWVMVIAALMAAAMLAVMSQSCIKNDIPYPRIQANFSSFEAEGLVSPASIDSANRIIDLVFDETVDMEKVSVTSYTLSPKGAEYVGGADFSEPVDLTRYLILTLRLYQDYDWVVRASQPVSRYFTVEGQIGEEIIDVAGKRVVVTVSENMGRKAVKVLTAKLGPEGSTMTPDPAGNTYDMTMPLEITVSVHGREEHWEVFCETAAGSVNTVRADAGSQVAWVYGAGLAGADSGVEYRVAGTQQWTQAPKTWITQTGATFFGRLINLEPETEYETRVYAATESGYDYGAVIKFTTGDLRQLPNSDFDQWSKVKKYDVPWPEGGEQFWDTSNPGSTKAGGAGNVFCSSQTSTGSGYSAELQSQFVNLFGFGQFASGSIYTGTFLGVDGMNGILGFGRPFDQRPVKLRGYFKYNTAAINYANDEFKDLIGEPDTCIVWCALTDFNEPLEIRTNPANRSLFDPEAGYTVAYGKMECGQTVPQFIPFEIELEYKSTQRVPKYIICVAASSKYGDYFTGGTGATMWVDDFELIYDY